MTRETGGTAMKPETEWTPAPPEPPPAPAEAAGAAPRRRAYAHPRLEVLGDVRDLTLGGSPGIGDSGDPLNFKIAA